jgi:hypothetical protein
MNIPKVETLYDLTSDKKLVTTCERYSTISMVELLSQINNWITQGASWKFDPLGWFLHSATGRKVVKLPEEKFAVIAKAHREHRNWKPTRYMLLLRERVAGKSVTY